MSIPKFEDTYYVFGDVRSSAVGGVTITTGVQEHLRNYCYYVDEYFPGHVAKHARNVVSLVKRPVHEQLTTDHGYYCVCTSNYGCRYCYR
jgi:hypothetical protein